MKLKLISLILILMFLQTSSHAFWFKKKYEKEKEQKAPMVHTVDEWLESATHVKMDMRSRDEVEKKEEKFLPTKDLPLYLEKYNVASGSRELDLSKIYENQLVRSFFVAEPNFSYATYTETYNYPQTQQIASTLYLIELDKHLGKKERLQDVSIFEHTRIPLISTAIPYLKKDLFSTLTLVDYSKNGDKILVKERTGSMKYGIYETYVWIYFLTDEDKESNQCYMNNLDFNNEFLNYTTLEGKEKKQNNDLYFLNDNNREEKELSKYGDDIKNLEDAPDYTLTTFRLVHGNKKEELQTLGHGTKLGNIDELTKEDNSYWIKEEILIKGKKQGQASSDYVNEPANLNYTDIKDFIKSVWKNDVVNSSYKNRWYNNPPKDYLAEISYEEKQDIGFGVRLNLLNEMIKAYWFDNQNLILNHIRWDLNPLGFSANGNEIIVLTWAYNKEGKKVSLGRWAVDLENGNPRLIPEDEEILIEANGLFLEGKLNPR